jgi:hypothetical protein
MHTSNYVGDFVFLTDANELVNSHAKIQSRFSEVNNSKSLHFIYSITFARRRKIAHRIASVNEALTEFVRVFCKDR